DSCITSPSLPVSASVPFPDIVVASVVRISPPPSVQASPVTSPLSFSVSRHGMCGNSPVLFPLPPPIPPIFRNSQIVADVVGAQCRQTVRSILQYGACNLPANRRNFPLQIAHPRLAGEIVDDCAYSIIGKFQVFRFQSVGFGLFWNQKS